MSHHASLKIAAISCALTESWYWGCHPALVFKRKPRKSFTKISKMNWHERWRSWLWNRFDLSTCLSSPILLWAAMALTHSSESSLQSVLVKTKFVLSASEASELWPTEEYYRQLIRNQNVILISGRKPIHSYTPPSKHADSLQYLDKIFIIQRFTWCCLMLFRLGLQVKPSHFRSPKKHFSSTIALNMSKNITIVGGHGNVRMVNT